MPARPPRRPGRPSRCPTTLAKDADARQKFACPGITAEYWLGLWPDRPSRFYRGRRGPSRLRAGRGLRQRKPAHSRGAARDHMCARAGNDSGVAIARAAIDDQNLIDSGREERLYQWAIAAASSRQGVITLKRASCSPTRMASQAPAQAAVAAALRRAGGPQRLTKAGQLRPVQTPPGSLALRRRAQLWSRAREGRDAAGERVAVGRHIHHVRRPHRAQGRLLAALRGSGQARWRRPRPRRKCRS